MGDRLRFVVRNFPLAEVHPHATMAAQAAEAIAGTDAERVSADFMSGVRSGVNGTLTFFVNGVRYDGDWSNFEAFRRDLTSG